MKNLVISSTESTPAINMNAETGIITIQGESYHEYTLEFFSPVFDWLHQYMKTPKRKITIHFKLIYFNTGSSRRFLEIMQLLEKYQQEKNGKVNIVWHYEKNDFDIQESGEKYAQDIKLTFSLVAY